MSAKSIDWKKYVNESGDFELPTYLFRMNKELMKQSLDLGTLLSSDPAKLRAFKEQIKKIFKERWENLAQALEYFDIIVPCTCDQNYCTICGGSRYLLNASLSPDVLREIAVFTGPEENPELQQKLEAGLQKALREVRE